MGYVAKLTDNDTQREVRFAKTFTSISSGRVRARAKFKSNCCGAIKLFKTTTDASNPAGSAVYAGMAYSPYLNKWELQYGDGSTTGGVAFDTNEPPDNWHIIEVEIDFDNGLIYGRLYDIEGNLIEEKSTQLPNTFTEVSVVAMASGAGEQTGESYFDDVEVYSNESLILSDDFDDGDVSDWQNTFGTGTLEAVQVAWSLQYRGRAIALRRGETGSVKFTIVPNGSTDTINISVADSDGLVVSVSPSQVNLDGTNPVDVTVSISVPSDKTYDIIWLVEVSFQGNEKTETGYVGVLPVNKQSAKVVVDTADQDSDGYWAGAPELHRVNDMFYVLYRKRNPSERGYLMRLVKSADLRNWSIVKEFTKDQAGCVSIEKSGLLIEQSRTVWLFSCDTGNGWVVKKSEADSIENIDVSSASTISITGDSEKDPEPISLVNSYLVGVADYNNKTQFGHDATLAESNDLSAFTVKLSLYDNLKANNNSWVNGDIHIGHLGVKDGWIVVFYDGANEIGYYNWLGIAIVKNDYSEVIDLTPDAPIMKGSSDTGEASAFRYASIYFDENMYVMAIEEGQPDGSHDLVIYYDGNISLAKFDITSVYPSSITTTPGATITINVTVRNIGDASGTVTINILDNNNNIVASTSISLAPGAEATKTFTLVAPTTPGTYRYTVNAVNNTTNNIDDTATITINVTTTSATTSKSNWLKWLLIGGIVVAGLLLVGRKKEE